MNRRLLGYALCLVIVLGCIGSAWAVQAATDGESSFDLLMPLSEQFMNGEQKMIVKHAGTYQSYTNDLQFLQIGQQLSQRFELPVSEEFTRDTDHLLYKTSVQDQPDGIDTSLLWIGFPDGTSELIITAQTTKPNEAATILSVQQHLADKLVSLHIKPQWNVMIQGIASNAYRTDASPLNDWLKNQLKAKVVEQYEDAGSTSITYYSPLFKDHITNGKQDMNLQVAVHRNSVTQQNRITIGIPAITVEY
ncbi:YwmB family TATA-box binding protein [Paenibacillus sp. UNC451MF]|uniref:YwmB family TATA-box binding protein n=1 Tax=Paenibacillus sp. UNC451MF TaxID=1449063 RepID=UPI000490CC6B|nr:YwmB family TATA-box binding protein [Paenibacillus sp. UNC451MF]